MSKHKPVGASYMPNWDLRPNDPRLWRRDTWTTLRNMFPRYMPLKDKNGYDENQQWVMDKSIEEAVWGNLDFWWFDTFFDHATGKFTGDHALKNFMNSEKRGLEFAISLDTSNSEIPFQSIEDFENFCGLLPEYMDDPRYQRKEGRPVLPIITFDRLHATDIGRMDGINRLLDQNVISNSTVGNDVKTSMAIKKLWEIARNITGLDIYVCGGIDVHEYWLPHLAMSGFEGHWFYNMFGVNCTTPPTGVPTTYDQLDKNYRFVWQWLIDYYKKPDHPKMDLWLSASAGWDSRALQDGNLIGRPTAEQFESHLQFAKSLGDLESLVVGYIIDAWNEHSEGGALEPILSTGRSLLSKVKKVHAPRL